MRSRHLIHHCETPLQLAAPPSYYFPPHPRPSYKSSASQNLHGVLSPPLTPEEPQRSVKRRSEHVESGPYSCYSKSTGGCVGRGMMPSSSPTSASTPSSSSSLKPNFTFPTLDSTPTFTFQILPRIETTLSFPPRNLPLRLIKRCRAVADVDGEHSCLHKKKRRLRLFLITSRLSPQFSHPATNIVDRGSSKIAVWAKQRASGSNLLRKAAILNRIRRQSIHALETAGGLGRVLVEQEKEQEQLHLARLTLMYGSHDSLTRPPPSENGPGLPQVVETRVGEALLDESSDSASASLRSCENMERRVCRSPNEAYAYSNNLPIGARVPHPPLPPSPLGLSNYDALDMEDEDPYAHLDEEYEAEDEESPSGSSASSLIFQGTPSSGGFGSSQGIFSDSNILEPDERVKFDFDEAEDAADASWNTAPPYYRCATHHVSTPPAPSRSKGQFDTPLYSVAPSPKINSSLSPTSSSPNFSGLYITSITNQQRKAPTDSGEMGDGNNRFKEVKDSGS